MESKAAVGALITDLQWQIDQLGPRMIKNQSGHPYNPSHYKRGLRDAIDEGGLAVVEFVRSYVHKAPSLGYKKLESCGSLDLACEALVTDETRPYADLFTDEDRAAARERLGPHADAIAARKAETRARIDAQRKKLRAQGMPKRYELESQLRSRR